MAAYLFTGAFGRFSQLEEKAGVLEKQFQLLRFQQMELERQARTLGRVQAFLKRVDAAGLAREDWATYQVRKKEPVDYFELEQVLNQSANTEAYYFKPLELQLLVKPPESTPESGSPAKPAADSDENGDIGLDLTFPQDASKDVMMILRGEFLVRRQ